MQTDAPNVCARSVVSQINLAVALSYVVYLCATYVVNTIYYTILYIHEYMSA